MMKHTLHENSPIHVNPLKSKNGGYKLQIVWRNVFLFSLLHLFALYGLWQFLTTAMWITIIFYYLYTTVSGMGITGGAHRLWAHRAYKAKMPLRIFLMICQSAMFQNDIYVWVRDHRVHHKFTDTNADPHNSTRGFFFSHMGWLLVEKHEDVFQKGKTIDMSDIAADPVVNFQRKYYLWLVSFWCFIIPAHIPWYFWGEDYVVSWSLTIFKYVISLHFTWLVNSAAHLWGTKSYDKNISPSDNKLVSALVFGEGWHNYHHVFPWDYKAAELGNYKLNLTTGFLDLMSLIGQAYDLKTASMDMVMKKVHRSGDGNWNNAKEYNPKRCNMSLRGR